MVIEYAYSFVIIYKYLNMCNANIVFSTVHELSYA